MYENDGNICTLYMSPRYLEFKAQGTHTEKIQSLTGDRLSLTMYTIEHAVPSEIN